jgi:hypothetical protein
MRHPILLLTIMLSVMLFCGMLLWRNRLADEIPNPNHLADEMPNLDDMDPLSGSVQRDHSPVTPKTRKLISQFIEPSAIGYVGSSQCTECHLEISQKFQTHPMAQSMNDVQGVRTIEDYEQNTSFSPDGNREYGVETVDGTVRHFEQFRDVSGNVVYRQSESIEFAVGSGQRGRSYLLNRDGLLFMSPVTWYSEGARWDLSPGYDPHAHPRFERRIADGCIACHAGTVRQEQNGPNRFAKEPFFEMSIGCERCHGPGKEHIDLQHRPYETEPQDSIVNPARLSPAQRESICYQCHLHGVNRVPRSGHSEFSFRPGALLSDVWTVFVSGNSVKSKGAPSHAVSQVEQMHESVCFKRSNGQLGCVSCHDPHSIPSKSERVNFFRERCLSCHEEKNRCSLEGPARLKISPEDSCIKCHMPKLAASDVPHTSQTDHRVLKLPRISRSFQAALPGGPPVPFAPEMFPVSAMEIARAEGIIFANFSEPMASNLSEEALWRFQQAGIPYEHDTALINAIGQTQLRVGRHEDAQRSLETAFSDMLGHESAIDSLVEIHERSGDLKMALAWAERSVEVNPSSSYGRSRLAFLLMRLKSPQRAISEAEIALQLNPLMHATRKALITFLSENDQADAAAAHQKILDRLQITAAERSP